jgi:hypothetical protein
MKAPEYTEGQKVALFDDVGRIVRVKNDRMAVVHFTGKTIDGRFSNMKGGCDCLISNLRPLKGKP